jgi:nitrate/TMAO reductase-like tetraheme cytochrome c subunit
MTMSGEPREPGQPEEGQPVEVEPSMPAPESAPETAPEAPETAPEAPEAEVPEGAVDAEDEVVAAAAADDAAPDGAAAPPPSRRSRIRRFFRLPRSRRALGALILIGGAFGIVGMIGGYQVIHWTETADFCGRCHTMGPELAAHEAGPHQQVSCGECHVEPGVQGWIAAKMNGTRQLVEIILGTFPEPIPPPEHDALPPAESTCQHCHEVARLNPSGMLARVQYTEDEPNTRQFVGLMVRPASSDVFDTSRGVHWHVIQDVEYWTDDPFAQDIDLVEATQTDGSTRTFIAQDRIMVAEDADPDVEALKADLDQVRMSCYDCHNRVGHPIPNPREGLDASLSAGRIDQSLPYIKREGMRILWSSYPTVEAADAEAEKLSNFYALYYPEVMRTKPFAVNAAIDQIQFLYRLTATPEMKITAQTYPDSLGHTDYPGCFRCHDGGHFLVADGAVTRTTIPSSCDTCHTFPQIGGAVASLPIGIPPESHDDTQYVFNHRDYATSEDPGGTSCGECHARDYCVNCHETGAVTVEHDQMLISHAESIRQSPTGTEACAYCHQPAYCSRCHTEPVLPGSAPWTAADTGALPKGPPGLEWPLFAVLPVATSP